MTLIMLSSIGITSYKDLTSRTGRKYIVCTLISCKVF